MEYKIVDVTGGEQGTFIFGIEEKIKAELAQGWQLWGSLIVIPPDFEGDQNQVWQAMVKDEEVYGRSWRKWEVGSAIVPAELESLGEYTDPSEWEKNGDDLG